MKEQSKVGLGVLKTAFIIGILADVLLRQLPWGLNVTLFNLAFICGLIMLARRAFPDFLNRQTVSLFGAWFFFALMFSWRDSIQLRIADTFAIIAILSILFLPRIKVWPSVAGVFQYIVGFIWSAANAFVSPLILLVSDIEWSSAERKGASRYLFGALRGIVIAAPLLVIFGALFMAADAAYQGMLERAFSIRPEVIFSHVLLTAGFAWLSAGYLRGVLLTGVKFPGTVSEEVRDATEADDDTHPVVIKLPDDLTIIEHINRSEEPNPTKSETAGAKKWSWSDVDNSVLPNAFTLGAVEISIVLGLLNLLFLSFVIVQTPYLFGGMDLVQNTPDYKLAEYARRGFGELVAVAALVLPILLIGHWLVRKTDTIAGKLFKVLAGIQIVLLFVIMASAVQRLVLLTGPLGYGLTIIRLYPLIFMSWLAVVFIWFCATVLRGARKHFAWGALWAAIIILAVTHVLNPDAFIAKTNLALMRQGRDFDAYYYRELSDDTVPVLVGAVDEMDQEDRQTLFRTMSQRYCRKQGETDLRSWNYSRWVASGVLEPYRDQLLQDVWKCYGDG